jgi:hypothetical protein
MKLHCYLCEQELQSEEAENFRGHYAHTSCIAAQMKACIEGPAGLSGKLGPGPHPKGEPTTCEKAKALGKEIEHWMDAQHPGWSSIAGKAPVAEDPYGRFAEPAPTPNYCLETRICVLPKGHTGTHDFQAGHSILPQAQRPEYGFPDELTKDSPDAQLIIKECHDICTLLLTKNRAYGSSFRRPLGVFSKLSPVEAINARMDDKLARIKQAKDFSEDTEADLIGYLILKKVLLKIEAHDDHVKAHLEDLCPTTGIPLAELKNEHKDWVHCGFWQKFGNPCAGCGTTYEQWQAQQLGPFTYSISPASPNPEQWKPNPEYDLLETRDKFIRETGLTPKFLYARPQMFGEIVKLAKRNCVYIDTTCTNRLTFCEAVVIERTDIPEPFIYSYTPIPSPASPAAGSTESGCSAGSEGPATSPPVSQDQKEGS